MTPHVTAKRRLRDGLWGLTTIPELFGSRDACVTVFAAPPGRLTYWFGSSDARVTRNDADFTGRTALEDLATGVGHTNARVDACVTVM